jgi:hypothetical protein
LLRWPARLTQTVSLEIELISPTNRTSKIWPLRRSIQSYAIRSVLSTDILAYDIRIYRDFVALAPIISLTDFGDLGDILRG